MTPRPDQFVFVEMVGANGYHRQDWYSVDGTRDGLIVQRTDAQSPEERTPLPGCRDGRRAAMRGPHVVGTEPCKRQPAFDPNLPTATAGILRYLQGLGGRPGDLNGLEKNVLFLIQGTYLLPATRAAVYEAAMSIPGAEGVPDEVDGIGRHGVGIAWEHSGGRHVMIFNPDTYEYLGDVYTAPPPYDTGGPSRSAVLHLTIVDEAGQRP